MKKYFWKSTFIIVSLGVMAGIAEADTYTFTDTWTNWPNYTTGYAYDQLGTPDVDNLLVTVENGILKKN